MPVFIYEGRDNQKQIKRGRRLAASAEILGDQLMKEGVIPISIVPYEVSRSPWLAFKAKLFEQPISLDDLGIFARQMYTLTKTGVPIARAIKHLADGTANKTVADALYGVVDQLEAGEDMASSMESYPRVFPPVVTNMIRVGQSSGRLAESFLRINQYLELESSTLKDLKTALRYPMLVSIAMIVAIVLMNIFVIPAFANMFAHSTMQLPLPTRILIGLSNFFVHYWGRMLLVTFVISGWIYFYLKTPNGKFKWDRFLLKVPALGKMIRGTLLLRFSQTFAMTIESGIPLIQGIELVAESMNNEYAKRQIMLMRDAVEHGNSITQAAALTGMFNSLELQMLTVSEETGELAPMLEQIALYYKRETEYDLKKLSGLIEPLMIVILSGMVLVLALAIYLPIWNMGQMMRGG